MFLKSLTIFLGDGTIIRNIQFHAGLNLIVDETPIVSGKETGNNVGKTTVLKLIDFCLGAKARGYTLTTKTNGTSTNLSKIFLLTIKCVFCLFSKMIFCRKSLGSTH